MTQDERWMAKCNGVVVYIQTNHRNPSKHDPEERFKYYNWFKHNRQLMNQRVMKPERVEAFNEKLLLSEKYKHINQWM